MDSIISKNKIYKKEKNKKSKKDSPKIIEIKNLTDKIYIITKRRLEENKSSSNKKKKEFSYSL